MSIDERSELLVYTSCSDEGFIYVESAQVLTLWIELAKHPNFAGNNQIYVLYLDILVKIHNNLLVPIKRSNENTSLSV